MSPNDAPLRVGLSWRMREREAQLLADALRSARLTLLLAGAGASRSALLAEGVVPLLARRQADVVLGGSPDSRVVAPFIDRRDADADAELKPFQREIVVRFSAWGPDPLAALLAAVAAATPADARDGLADAPLARLLESVCERLDARLLFLLDDFEQFWIAEPDPAAAARFVEALATVTERAPLPVNFLLALDERFEGRLTPFRRAIAGFDDSTVRLLGFERDDSRPAPSQAKPVPAPPPPDASAVLPTLTDAVAPPQPRRPRPPKTPRAPTVPIKADGVYAFIESTLSKTADPSVPWQDPRAVPHTEAPQAQVPTHGRSKADTFGQMSVVGPSPPASQPHAAEPPSPIDDWIDAAIAWWRRFRRPR